MWRVAAAAGRPALCAGSLCVVSATLSPGDGVWRVAAAAGPPALCAGSLCVHPATLSPGGGVWRVAAAAGPPALCAGAGGVRRVPAVRVRAVLHAGRSARGDGAARGALPPADGRRCARGCVLALVLLHPAVLVWVHTGENITSAVW